MGERVVAIVDGAHAPGGAARSRIAAELIVENAGQIADRVAHPERVRRGIARFARERRRGAGAVVVGIEAAEVVDRFVLRVLAVVIRDGAGADLLQIGRIARSARLELVGVGLELPIRRQLDLVEAVELELLGDRQRFGNADVHALVGFEIRLILVVLIERRGRSRQIDVDPQGVGMACAGRNDGHAGDRDLRHAEEFAHRSGDAHQVAFVDIGVAAEDENAFRRQRIGVPVDGLFLQVEAVEAAPHLAVAALEITDDDAFDRHDGAGASGLAAPALHVMDEMRDRAARRRGRRQHVGRSGRRGGLREGGRVELAAGAVGHALQRLRDARAALGLVDLGLARGEDIDQPAVIGMVVLVDDRIDQFAAVTAVPLGKSAALPR